MSMHKKPHKLDVPEGKSDQTAAPYAPTFEEITARAYEAFVKRGRINGFDLEDWLQAERELRANGNKRAT